MTKEEAENYVAAHPGPCPRCGAPLANTCSFASDRDTADEWFVEVGHHWTCGHEATGRVGQPLMASAWNHRIPCHVRTDFIDTCVAVFVAMGRPVDMALIQRAVDERHPAPKKEEDNA